MIYEILPDVLLFIDSDILMWRTDHGFPVSLNHGLRHDPYALCNSSRCTFIYRIGHSDVGHRSSSLTQSGLPGRDQYDLCK